MKPSNGLFILILCSSFTLTALPQSWVSSVSPQQNALNVIDSTDITITFTQDINPVSLTNSTIKVNGSMSGLHTSSNITYNAGTKTAIFDPDEKFYVGEIVFVTLTTGIQNTIGNPMQAPYNWSFTVVVDAGSGVFVQIDTPSVGNYPSSLTTGDFDSDGDLDLAVANGGTDNLSILMNDGTGNFSQESTPSVGDDPSSVTTGDLDSDGDLDLAVANDQWNSVSILINDGIGNFAQTATAGVGSDPTSVINADLDSDGDLDLAVANRSSNNVSILMNDGNANFTQSSTPSVLNGPSSLTTNDLDSDGDLDLAVTNFDGNTISILKNDGAGNFVLTSSPVTGDLPRSIVSGDIDDDGDVDLGVAISDSILILKNDGSGNFTEISMLISEYGGKTIFFSDLDDDGDLDLAVANSNYYNPPGTVTTLTNDGNGNFAQFSIVNVRYVPTAIIGGDFNADGDIDLAVTNIQSNNVSILFNRNSEADILLSTNYLRFGRIIIDSTKSVRFTVFNYGIDSVLQISNVVSSNPAFVSNPTSASILPGDSLMFTISFTPTAMVTCFDSLTIFSNDPNNPQIKVYLSGDWSRVASYTPSQNALNIPQNTIITVIFATDINASTINPNNFVVRSTRTGLKSGVYSYNSGTKTGIFIPDLEFFIGENVQVTLTSEIQTSTGDSIEALNWDFTITTGSGSGHFRPTELVVLGESPVTALMGDFDDDADLDLAVVTQVSKSVHLFTNNGIGNFQLASISELPDYITAATSGDFNGDGHLDLAVCQCDLFIGGNYISLLMNDGNGNFTITLPVSIGESPHKMATSDFDGDGDLDFAVVNTNSNSISICINDGTGILTEVIIPNVGPRPIALTTGDFDGDEDLDLALTDEFSAEVTIFSNESNGNFMLTSTVAVRTYPMSITKGDFDGDGDLDLAVANNGENNISILMNNGSAIFSETSIPWADNPSSVSTGDIDADGDLDLVVTNEQDDQVLTLINNGSGIFTQLSISETGENPISITTGDLDGDSDLDLAVANEGENNISVLFNRNSQSEILLFSALLDFEFTKLDSTKNLPLTIYNIGIDSTLQISNITSSNPAFQIIPTSASLSPGDSIVLMVYFTPTDLIFYSDSLTIYSNDMNQPQTTVYVSGDWDRITSHSPWQNILSVSRHTNISVTFAAAMNPSTINPDAFIVHASYTGLLTGVLSYSNTTNTVVFDPDSAFKNGEIVNVTLANEIQTSTGDSLPKPYQWNFTVISDSSSGEFTLTSTVAVEDGPSSVTAGDFDLDSDLDLAVANRNGGTVSILDNDGTGNYTQTSTVSVGGDPFSIVTGDWDNDKDLDLAVTNWGSNDLSILMNDGIGSFVQTLMLPLLDDPQPITTGDLDGDGYLDLAIGSVSVNKISIVMNDGTGNFSLASTPFLAGKLKSITTGDLDGDGDLDLAGVDYFEAKIFILMNIGNGHFIQTFFLDIGDRLNDISIGDLDGDGDLDLVVTTELSNTVALLQNNDNGIFIQGSTISVGQSPIGITVGDLDGDGDLDLAVANNGSNTTSILKNNGSGNFSQSSVLNVGNGPSSLTHGDFNEDGDLDLAVANWGSDNISILSNKFLVGIDNDLSNVPKEYALHQNFPNPFNPITTIKYDLPKATKVEINIYNILGQKVKTIVNANQIAGYKSVIWDGKNQMGEMVASGIYVYKIKTESFSKVRKMLFLK